MVQTLSLRQLNRATLERQMVLRPGQARARQAVQALYGLQAQVNNSPYISLWTRLESFDHDDLTALLRDGLAVRATLMRSTLHVVARADFLRMWAVLQPASIKALRGFHGKRIDGLDLAAVGATARAIFAQGPISFAELRPLLTAQYPDRTPEALAFVVRSQLPLVQLPPGGYWSTGGTVRYALAEPPGGYPPDDEAFLELALRYLAAYGPASGRDLQAWSGLPGAAGRMNALRHELAHYHGPDGQALFDLPGRPLPDADTPAPPRFLPEYDNLILSHQDRTRVMPDAYRKGVFLSAARVRATYLIDGMVAGAWRVERVKKAAALVIEPFAPLIGPDRDALLAEGERLIRFISRGEAEIGVRVED